MLDQVQTVRQFNRFYTKFIGLLEATLLDSPVTLIEGRILFEISQSANCTATALTEILGLDRGYISRLLTRLVHTGLVRRGTDPADKRVRHLELTSDGERILNMINQRADDHIGGILKSIHSPDRKRLVKAMIDIQKILAGTGGTQTQSRP